MAAVGEAYLGRTSFLDGTFPSYSRPYLVVEVASEGVYVLNVSTTQGKEHKLVFPANYLLQNYNPPFIKSSFVKLDSKTFISNTDLASFKRLSGGRKLNTSDLTTIITRINQF